MSIPDSDTFKVLQEVANDANLGDAFRVKVDFKASAAGMPQRFAIFRDVPLEHITSAEPWLEQLSGSAKGIFVLLISHESQPAKTIGGAITVAFHNGRHSEAKFDWTAFERPAYSGPRVDCVVFPSSPGALAPTQPATTAAPTTPAAPRNASGIGELVPLLQTLVTQQQRGTGADPYARVMEMQQEDRRAAEAMRREERERQEKREEKEREREEQRRREDREREDRREERERQHQKQMFEVQQENTKTLMALMTREPPKNPVMDALLQKAITGGDEAGQKAAALIAQMGGFMSQMTGMTVQLLHTQAELNGNNQPENPIWGIAGKLIDGYFGSVGEQQEEIADALEENAQKALPAADEPALDGVEGEEEEEAPAPPTDTAGEEPSVEAPLQRLDRAIHQEAPLRELSDALCMALVTPDFSTLYQEAKGDIRALVTKRYGKWAEATDIKGPQRKAAITRRVKYLTTMLPKAWAVAVQRGIIRRNPPPANQPQAHAPRAAVKRKPAEQPASPEKKPPELAVVEGEKKEPA